MSGVEITDIERALVGELGKAADAGRLGYRWGTLESYPEEFDAYLKAQKGQIRYPAAWAVFLNLGDPYDDDDAGVVADASFALVVAAQSIRGETESRHGGPNVEVEPGSYRLMRDAVRILSGSMLCLDLVKPIEVTGARPYARSAEMRTQGLSIIAIAVKCTVPFGRFDDDSDVLPFERFHADYDVPPLGNVEPPLPASNPDAEDMVELPQ